MIWLPFDHSEYNSGHDCECCNVLTDVCKENEENLALPMSPSSVTTSYSPQSADGNGLTPAQVADGALHSIESALVRMHFRALPFSDASSKAVIDIPGPYTSTQVAEVPFTTGFKSTEVDLTFKVSTLGASVLGSGKDYRTAGLPGDHLLSASDSVGTTGPEKLPSCISGQSLLVVSAT
jgi:hypothetical protein